MKIIIAAGDSLEVHAYKLDNQFRINKAPVLSKIMWTPGEEDFYKSIDYSYLSKDNSINLASNRFDVKEVKVETWDLALMTHKYQKYDKNCLY